MWLRGWIQSSSSDLQKSIKFFPNLISQLFIAVHEINYPSCFIVYYEMKQRRNYSVDHAANPAPLERIRRVSVRAVSSFIRELKHQTFSGGRRQPEVKFTSYPRFPPTRSAVATLRRLCFAYFDVACKT